MLPAKMSAGIAAARMAAGIYDTAGMSAGIYDGAGNSDGAGNDTRNGAGNDIGPCNSPSPGSGISNDTGPSIGNDTGPSNSPRTGTSPGGPGPRNGARTGNGPSTSPRTGIDPSPGPCNGITAVNRKSFLFSRLRPAKILLQGCIFGHCFGHYFGRFRFFCRHIGAGIRFSPAAPSSANPLHSFFLSLVELWRLCRCLKGNHTHMIRFDTGNP
jgi:hypothetical protein